MRRFLATTLGQIVAIVACSMLATCLLFLALVAIQNTAPGPPWPWAVTHRIVSLVNLLEGVPEQYRGRASLLEYAQKENLAVMIRPGAMPCTARSFDSLTLHAGLRIELGRYPGLHVGSCDGDDPAGNIQVLVPMGRQVLEIRTRNLGWHPVKFNSPGFAALLSMFVIVVAMSLWAVWRVVRPLQRLSEQAEAFGRDIAPAPIIEEGPAELRNVARAFNLMQERVTRSIQERTRMLAAISHDLRTPITRMRLQLESAGKDADPGRLLKNLELMQAMVTSALAFLNGAHDSEEKQWVDLDSLLSTLCDEYAEAGANVRYHGPVGIDIFCRLNAMQRALANLIDNAVHFGRSTAVTASIQDDAVVIEVADDGPGIPDEHLQDVVQPFVRLDASRGTRAGSIGLGLSIVDEIVRAHGGTLALANRQPRGLSARIALPASGAALRRESKPARPG